MSDRVQETEELPGDPASILAIVTDFESYPDWQPQMAEAEVLERDAEGRGTLVRYKFKGQMFTANYTLAYAYDDDGVAFHAGDGRTRVTYELEASPAIKIPAVLRRQGAKRMVEDLFAGLRAKLDG